jgi:pectate lyase
MAWSCYVNHLVRLLAWIVLFLPDLAHGLPAFPGAEGFGSDTPGGRGGDVHVVTTLRGRGPGSFRAAINASGPRIIVFAVSGTVQGRLEIKEPYLTIAGQTAPGGGIAIHGAEGGALEIKTHDVVIRHLRLRSGPPDMPDTLRLGREAHHVVIDHCSISWGIDENLAVLGHTNSIQWSIISEGLRSSTHKMGEHSMGAVLGAGNVTVHHSLFAHNNARNPRIGGSGTTVDFVNNVIYNFGSAITRVTAGPNLGINYVGNSIIKGPDSGSAPVFAIARNYPVSIFAESNARPASIKLVPGSREHVLAARRHAAPRVTTQPARDAYEEVVAHAGASLPRRDGCPIWPPNPLRRTRTGTACPTAGSGRGASIPTIRATPTATSTATATRTSRTSSTTMRRGRSRLPVRLDEAQVDPLNGPGAACRAMRGLSGCSSPAVAHRHHRRTYAPSAPVRSCS